MALPTMMKVFVHASEMLDALTYWNWAFCDVPGRNEQPSALQRIHAINSMITSGTVLGGLALYYLGAPHEVVKNAKTFEYFTRVINLPTKLAVEVEHELRIKDPNTTRAILRVFHQGVILPAAAAMRAKAEAEQYGLECKTKTVEVTIFDPNEEPVCKKQKLDKEAEIAWWTYVGVFGELLDRRDEAHFDVRRVAAIMVNHVNAQQEAADLEMFDLTRLPFIPEPLHNDPVFRRYICPLTQRPIRFVVADPTFHGRVLYERAAIRTALAVRPQSPVTRAPLRVAQLLARPAVQNEINTRLRQLQELLTPLLDLLIALPVDQVGRNMAQEEHPTDEVLPV